MSGQLSVNGFYYCHERLFKPEWLKLIYARRFNPCFKPAGGFYLPTLFTADQKESCSPLQWKRGPCLLGGQTRLNWWAFRSTVWPVARRVNMLEEAVARCSAETIRRLSVRLPAAVDGRWMDCVGGDDVTSPVNMSVARRLPLRAELRPGRAVSGRSGWRSSGQAAGRPGHACSPCTALNTPQAPAGAEFATH